MADEFYNLAITLKIAGRLEESEKLHRQALALREKLASDFPEIPEYRHRVAVSYISVGGALLKLPGRGEDAEKAMRHAVELLDKLASEFPQYLPAVANSLKVMGDALASSDRKAAAEECLRRCVVVNQSLVSDFPTEMGHRTHLAGAYLNLGNILRETDRWVESEQAYRTSLMHRERVVEQGTDNPLYRQYLALSQNNLAYVLANSPDLASRDVPQATKLSEKAVATSRENPIFRSTLGVVRYRAGDWKNAITEIEKSLELSKRGDSSDWFCLAMAHWHLGKREKATNYYAQAVDWMQKNRPNDHELQRFQDEASQLLGIKK